MKKLFLISSLMLGLLVLASIATAGFWNGFGKSVITGNVIAVGGEGPVNITGPGKCVSDTDQGRRKYVFGTTTYRTGRMVNLRVSTRVDDVCGENNTLIEHWCDENKTTMEMVMRCPDTCIAGVCTAVNAMERECKDSDKGINPPVPGYVKESCEGCSSDGNNDSDSTEQIYLDRCIGPDDAGQYTLVERHCGLNKRANETLIRCIGECTTKKINVEGTQRNAGKCKPMVSDCIDTDGGINATVRGITSALGEGNKPVIILEDQTKKRPIPVDGPPQGPSKSIIEYYCDENGAVANVTLNCPTETGKANSIAYEGACTSNTPLCEDDDAPANLAGVADVGQANAIFSISFATKGTTTSITGESVTDYCPSAFNLAEMSCKDNSNGPSVRESYKNQKIYRKIVHCVRGCMNGACVGGLGYVSYIEGANYQNPMEDVFLANICQGGGELQLLDDNEDDGGGGRVGLFSVIPKVAGNGGWVGEEAKEEC